LSDGITLVLVSDLRVGDRLVVGGDEDYTITEIESRAGVPMIRVRYPDVDGRHRGSMLRTGDHFWVHLPRADAW
jgi:hypothetical protein